MPFFYRDLEPGAASHGFGEGSGKMVAQLPAMAMTAMSAIEAFGLTQPTHLKIDVDGAEFRVLVGFAARLNMVKEIMIELPNEGHALESIHSLLKDRGFALAESYTERDGHAIGNIHYELHRRE